MFNLHRKLIGAAPMTYNVGAGQGFGQANVVQTVNAVQANSRANRQQEFKDRQIKIMETEQAKQQQVESGAGDLQKQVQSLQQEIASMRKQQAGTKVKTAMANVATSVGGENVAPDFAKQVNSDKDMQKALGAKPNDIQAFDAKARRDNDAFFRYLGKNNIDYTAWSAEYIQKVKDSFADSGIMYNFQGDLIDGSPVIEATDTMNMIGTEGINIYEGKKANLGALLQGEESYNKKVSELSADPEKHNFFTDYLSKLPKSEQDKLKARKAELGKMTNAEAQADLQVTSDVAPTNQTAQTTVDTTKNVDGSQANIPETVNLNEPIIETEPRVVTTPDGGTVKVKTNEDGSETVQTTQGTTITKKKDGTSTVTESTGRKSMVAPNGAVTTVAPDGTVSKSYTLPPSVQMAYDMLGIKSAYEDNKDPLSVAGKAGYDYEANGLGTFKQGYDAYMKANSKVATRDSDFKFFTKNYLANPDNKGKTIADAKIAFDNKKPTKNTEWADFYSDWSNDPSNKGKTVAQARLDFKANKPDKKTDWEIYRTLPENAGKPLAQVRKEFKAKQDSNPPKQPDKLAMDKSYQEKRDAILSKIDDNRLNKDPDNYTPVGQFSDITAEEWANMSEQEYNDLKMAFNNTKTKLSETQQKAYDTTTSAINALQTISERYNSSQSGFGQNILRELGVFTGIDTVGEKGIKDRAVLNKAIASLIIDEATAVGGRPSATLINMMKEEVGKLRDSDPAVYAKFEQSIKDTVNKLEAQKKNNPDGYYLRYKGDPLVKMKNIQRNLSLASGSKVKGVTTPSSAEAKSVVADLWGE